MQVKSKEVCNRIPRETSSEITSQSLSAAWRTFHLLLKLLAARFVLRAVRGQMN